MLGSSEGKKRPKKGPKSKNFMFAFFGTSCRNFLKEEDQIIIEQYVLHSQPQGTCERAMGENRISEGMICAFGVGKDTCQVIYYIIAIVIRMAMI